MESEKNNLEKFFLEKKNLENDNYIEKEDELKIDDKIKYLFYFCFFILGVLNNLG
jgi:hypothetical protein